MSFGSRWKGSMATSDRPVESKLGDAAPSSPLRIDPPSRPDGGRSVPNSRATEEEPPSWDVPHAPTSASLRMLQLQPQAQEHAAASGATFKRPSDGASEQSSSKHGGGLGVSLPRVVGGALAAASAAVASSFLGVAGTVTGAVLVSVVVSVGTALYSRPIERTSQVLKETLPPRLERGRVAVTSVAPKPVGATSLQRLRERFGAVGSSGESGGASAARRWGAVTLSAGAMLALAFVLLTGLEDVTGKPVSAWTGHSSDSGTTLGHLFGQGPKDTGTKHPGSPHKPHHPNGGQQTTPNPTVRTTAATEATTAPTTESTPTPTLTTTPTVSATPSTTAPARTATTSPPTARKAPPTSTP
jgi:hypothetical protein